MSQDIQDTAKENGLILDLLTERLAEKAAQKIGINTDELRAYLLKRDLGDHQLSIPLFRLIEEHNLDPMLDQVDWIEESYDSINAKRLYITLNGCIKIMNSHLCFQGIEFITSETKEGVAPAWIDCAIYRSDRIRPIIVREYLSEANLEGEIWQKMPSRMLRNRALTQCVRIAFGINAIDADLVMPREKRQSSEQKNLRANTRSELQGKSLGAKGLKLALKDGGQPTIKARD